MKLAIMQPYFFPYLGYFQLISACDRFVVYDDVNFIKGGWVNRNRILVGGEEKYISVQMQGASPYRIINEIELSDTRGWREKVLRTVRQAYARAPNVHLVCELFEHVVLSDVGMLGSLAVQSVRATIEFLGIDVDLVPTSACYQNSHLSGQNRVIDICQQNDADVYVNMIGGRALYDGWKFRTSGITLEFLQPVLPTYSQTSRGFIPGLSIIDVLMFNDACTVREFLQQYEIVPAIDDHA